MIDYLIRYYDEHDNEQEKWTSDDLDMLDVSLGEYVKSKGWVPDDMPTWMISASITSRHYTHH